MSYEQKIELGENEYSLKEKLAQTNYSNVMLATLEEALVILKELRPKVPEEIH